tara:strand:+ start:728 stop:1273 length:546 start_codon:yes stop_codon:yes gene_type:complete
MKTPIKVSVLLCFFLLSSCYESLDFNQVDEYVSKPVFTSALTYFTLVPTQFFDSNGNQKNSISDITSFYGFQNTYVKDNLVKLEFNAEIKNEFDREVAIQIDLLNKNNAVTYAFEPIIVESGDLNYLFFKEIEIASNQNILNTEKVRITVRIDDTGTPMNANVTSGFVFKSSVTLFIESSI